MNNPIRNIEITTENHQHRITRYVILCAFALLVPNFAGAGGWEIDPVRVELTPEQKTASITVKNGSDQPTSIQIQTVAWSQHDGKDVYTPTKELLVSPPIVTIAPQGEQIIRVALRRKADATNELTYRISLQELPSQPLAGFSGVQVAMRITLPVFVQSQKGGASPKVAWAIKRMPDNVLKVSAKNQGNAHIQISNFALYVPGDDKPIVDESASSYILAGQSHEWLLKTGALRKITADRLNLRADTDADNVDTELVLGKP
jgi:fimbrial chaperone protein